MLVHSDNSRSPSLQPLSRMYSNTAVHGCMGAVSILFPRAPTFSSLHEVLHFVKYSLIGTAVCRDIVLLLVLVAGQPF